MQVWTMACASIVAMVGEAVTAGVVLARGTGKTSKVPEQAVPVGADKAPSPEVKKEL